MFGVAPFAFSSLQEKPATVDSESQLQDPLEGLVVLEEVWAKANQGIAVSTVYFFPFSFPLERFSFSRESGEFLTVNHLPKAEITIAAARPNRAPLGSKWSLVKITPRST